MSSAPTMMNTTAAATTTSRAADSPPSCADDKNNTAPPGGSQHHFFEMDCNLCHDTPIEQDRGGTGGIITSCGHIFCRRCHHNFTADMRRNSNDEPVQCPVCGAASTRISFSDMNGLPESIKAFVNGNPIELLQQASEIYKFQNSHTKMRLDFYKNTIDTERRSATAASDNLRSLVTELRHENQVLKETLEARALEEEGRRQQQSGRSTVTGNNNYYNSSLHNNSGSQLHGQGDFISYDLQNRSAGGGEECIPRIRGDTTATPQRQQHNSRYNMDATIPPPSTPLSRSASPFHRGHQQDSNRLMVDQHISSTTSGTSSSTSAPPPPPRRPQPQQPATTMMTPSRRPPPPPYPQYQQQGANNHSQNQHCYPSPQTPSSSSRTNTTSSNNSSMQQPTPYGHHAQSPAISRGTPRRSFGHPAGGNAANPQQHQRGNIPAAREERRAATSSSSPPYPHHQRVDDDDARQRPEKSLRLTRPPSRSSSFGVSRSNNATLNNPQTPLRSPARNVPITSYVNTLAHNATTKQPHQHKSSPYGTMTSRTTTMGAPQTPSTANNKQQQASNSSGGGGGSSTSNHVSSYEGMANKDGSRRIGNLLMSRPKSANRGLHPTSAVRPMTSPAAPLGRRTMVRPVSAASNRMPQGDRKRVGGVVTPEHNNSKQDRNRGEGAENGTTATTSTWPNGHIKRFSAPRGRTPM